MSGWVLFWTVFFFASLALFMGLSVVVSIGGYADIRSLFREIKRQGEEEESLP